jgi:trimeric autotransporter adhesin
VQLYGDIPCTDGEGSLLPDRSPDSNAILGNSIGTRKNGTTALGNAFSGVSVFGGAGPDNNLIGLMVNPNTAAKMYNPNVISGSSTGVYVDSEVSGLIIAGNFIGTDLSGTLNLADATAST